MFNWGDIAAQRERYGDLVREVEHDRLVRQLLARHEAGARFYHRLLAWLGHVLIAAGKHLQGRYGNAAPISKPLASLGR